LFAELLVRLGLTTKDDDFSAVWLTRVELDMVLLQVFLHLLGLMNMSDLQLPFQPRVQRSAPRFLSRRCFNSLSTMSHAATFFF